MNLDLAAKAPDSTRRKLGAGQVPPKLCLAIADDSPTYLDSGFFSLDSRCMADSEVSVYFANLGGGVFWDKNIWHGLCSVYRTASFRLSVAIQILALVCSNLSASSLT